MGSATESVPSEVEGLTIRLRRNARGGQRASKELLSAPALADKAPVRRMEDHLQALAGALFGSAYQPSDGLVFVDAGKNIPCPEDRVN